MNAKELIEEIQKLPFRDRMYVIERSMHLIRKQEEEEEMKRAAAAMYEDYLTDPELTAFTNIDGEPLTTLECHRHDISVAPVPISL